MDSFKDGRELGVPSVTFGYVRVSTKEQNEDRQLIALREAGIEDRYIFIDKQSGKDFNRPKYLALKNILREGDLLVVMSIDRLGRNYQEIKSEWQEITQVIKADIRVLDMPLLDTRQYKDLLGTFIADLVLQVLAFVAEQERVSIKQRQKEGIAAARAKGKHLGRARIEMPEGFEAVYSEWRERTITAKTAMNKLGLKRTTFYKLVKEFEKM